MNVRTQAPRQRASVGERDNRRPMFEVPTDLVADRVRVSGEIGRRWVEALPDRVAALCREWSVAVDDTIPVSHGANALVVPVRRGPQPLVLKVTWHHPTLADQATALSAWAGRGAVALVDVRLDDGALLLERLDASRSLSTIPIVEAAARAGELIRRLTVPAPAGLPRVAEAGRLDVARAEHWSIVRAVDYWLWGLEHGLTVDPERCRRVLSALS